MKSTHTSQWLTTTLVAGAFFLSQSLAGCAGCNKPQEVATNSDSVGAVKPSLADLYNQTKAQDSAEGGVKVVRETRVIREGGGTPKPNTGGTQTGVKVDQINYENMDEVLGDLENELKNSLDVAWKNTGKKGYVQFQLTITPDGTVKSVQMLHNDLDAQAEATIKNAARKKKFEKHTTDAGDIQSDKIKILSP